MHSPFLYSLTQSSENDQLAAMIEIKLWRQIALVARAILRTIRSQESFVSILQADCKTANESSERPR